MPELSRFYGIVIRMYFRDHGPPHFHAEYAGEGGAHPNRGSRCAERTASAPGTRFRDRVDCAAPGRLAGGVGAGKTPGSSRQDRPAGVIGELVHGKRHSMKTLAPNLRKQLERTIADARDVAETGARVALEGLAVHHREPYAHMSEDQRALRQRLRARARQLGDSHDPRSRSHEIGHLAHECAYEHWHGMLFARFLAENRLLIEPELDVPVTLDECEELGKDEGVDKWTMAARFAHGMLPQVFRPDHPAFEISLAREYRLKLEGLAESLPPEVFAATDSLGWVYQFWQSRKKAEVNRSEVKVGADELPAVTQLFTEPYMVSFLLDNTLGAWWASRRLSEADLQEADTEVDLRRKAAIPDAPLDFLRFVRSEDTAEQDELAPCRRPLRRLAGAPCET